MQKNKLKSFSLKDIKSHKRRKHKLHLKQLKGQKSHYQSSLKSPPPRFLDPFQFHRIISDFIVVEELGKINDRYFSALYHVIQLKHITQIDFFDDFTYAKFENANNYPYSPLDLVISRLRSMGNQAAHKFSEEIAEYKEMCLLIKSIKQFGYQKEVLNSFQPKHLNFMKEYFKAMMATSLTPEQVKMYINETFIANQRNPVFFLIYDEYKDYVGAHLKGIGVNKAMRKLIGWKEFDICDRQIWCVEAQNYYNYIGRLFKMFVINEPFFQELFVCTKLGFYKIKFEVKTHFIVTPSKKMHFTLLVAKEMTSVDQVPGFILDAFWDEGENKEKFSEDQCEQNKNWNRLIDCYFDFYSKKTEEEEKKI